MADMTFFEPVPQFPSDFHGTEIMRPVFYHDYTSIQVLFLTPVEKIRAFLPSRRLHPMRLTPRSAVTVISVIEHRDSGVGPYNLALIGFPVTVDREAPILRGLLKAVTGGAGVFVWQMPENSHLPIESGIETVGYPKFMAKVGLEEGNGWMVGRVEEDDQHILSLSVRSLTTQKVDRRFPGDLYVHRDPWIRRVPFVTNIKQVGTSMKQGHARLELGDHPIADELRQLELGRAINVQYSPESQQILGSVLDGWKADRTLDRWRPSDLATVRSEQRQPTDHAKHHD
jgi:hypothetical protein